MPLVLASASERRAELLAAAGFAFDVLPVDVDECVRAGEAPADYVRRLASEKSARAMEIIGNSPPEGGHYVRRDVVVLGADTAVVVDDHILGKPRDEGDARDMLRRLSGRSHQVMTGVSLRAGSADTDEMGGLETTTVWFASLSPADIDWYAATGEGRDKAGAYAIQGLASRFIPRIEGSYSNVVGLPVALAYRLLRKLNRVIG